MNPATDNARAALDASGELCRTFRGDLLLPHDQRYETARRVWNASIDRHPALIARCADTRNVVGALRAARRHGLEVAVRGGGHSIAGLSVADGAMTIDLSLMAAVHVDPDVRRATVQAGQPAVRSRPGDTAARAGRYQRLRLAHRSRRPDPGRRVRVDRPQARAGLRQPPRGRGRPRGRERHGHQRRARPRPAVGTARRRRELRHRHLLRVRVAPGRADGDHGRRLHDIADGRAVLEAYREFAAEATDETTWVASVWDAEPGSPVPEQYHGKPVVSLAFVHIGDVEEGAALGRRLRSAAQTLGDMAGPCPTWRCRPAMTPSGAMGCAGTGSRTTCGTCRTPPSTPSWAAAPRHPAAARPSPDRCRPGAAPSPGSASRTPRSATAAPGSSSWPPPVGPTPATTTPGAPAPVGTPTRCTPRPGRLRQQPRHRGRRPVREAYGAQKFQRPPASRAASTHATCSISIRTFTPPHPSTDPTDRPARPRPEESAPPGPHADEFGIWRAWRVWGSMAGRAVLLVRWRGVRENAASWTLRCVPLVPVPAGCCWSRGSRVLARRDLPSGRPVRRRRPQHQAADERSHVQGPAGWGRPGAIRFMHTG